MANIRWNIEKPREFQKNIYFYFIDYAKAFDCVDHNKLWIIINRWEYQTTVTASWVICIRVKKKQNQTWNHRVVPDWERSIWRLYNDTLLINLYAAAAEYIMWNASLDEAQAGIEIARTTISNFRYADDTTLRAESEEELKSLLIKVKKKSEKKNLA